MEAICVHIWPTIFAEARAITEGITELLVFSVDIHATCFSLLLLLVSLYSLVQSPPISLSLPSRFLLTCLCSLGVYLLRLLGILSLSFSLISFRRSAQFSWPSPHWQTHTHQLSWPATNTHTSLTAEVDHLNRDVWTASLSLYWIITLRTSSSSCQVGF